MGTSASLIAGTFISALTGAAIGGAFVIGQFLYDGYMFGPRQKSIGVTNFNAAINSGWTPR